ncbi:MAG: NUDIX hydrolase [Oscillospiraceae bacterium]|nr:NUDIX hydrolase [Oscillospiraceae bacterium]
MMGYISELRKYVGHAPIIHLAASVIVEDSEGRILMQHRADNGCWGYCGGSVELFEKVEDAACRELYEETGLTADNLRLFGVFSGEDCHYIYPNGDEVSTVDILYICDKFHGELKVQSEEVTELEFMDIDKLPDDISPPIIAPLKKYIEYRRTEQTGRGAIF